MCVDRPVASYNIDLGKNRFLIKQEDDCVCLFTMTIIVDEVVSQNFIITQTENHIKMESRNLSLTLISLQEEITIRTNTLSWLSLVQRVGKSGRSLLINIATF